MNKKKLLLTSLVTPLIMTLKHSIKATKETEEDLYAEARVYQYNKLKKEAITFNRPLPEHAKIIEIPEIDTRELGIKHGFVTLQFDKNEVTKVPLTVYVVALIRIIPESIIDRLRRLRLEMQKAFIDDLRIITRPKIEDFVDERFFKVKTEKIIPCLERTIQIQNRLRERPGKQQRSVKRTSDFENMFKVLKSRNEIYFHELPLPIKADYIQGEIQNLIDEIELECLLIEDKNKTVENGEEEEIKEKIDLLKGAVEKVDSLISSISKESVEEPLVDSDSILDLNLNIRDRFEPLDIDTHELVRKGRRRPIPKRPIGKIIPVHHVYEKEFIGIVEDIREALAYITEHLQHILDHGLDGFAKCPPWRDPRPLPRPKPKPIVPCPPYPPYPPFPPDSNTPPNR